MTAMVKTVIINNNKKSLKLKLNLVVLQEHFYFSRKAFFFLITESIFIDHVSFNLVYFYIVNF